MNDSRKSDFCVPAAEFNSPSSNVSILWDLPRKELFCDFGNTALHDAAIAGDCLGVTNCISEGISVNLPNNVGDRPLHMAARRGLEVVALALILEGADASLKNAQNEGPMDVIKEVDFFYKFLFICNDSHTWKKDFGDVCVDKEFKEKVFLNQKGKEGNTKLHMCVINWDNEGVESLLNQGAMPNLRNEKGDTPLHIATQHKRSVIFQLLLDKQVSVNCKNKEGNSPLHLAAIFGHNELASVLISVGSDLQSLNNKGFTPIHEAVLKNQVEIVKLFISGGHVSSQDINSLIEISTYEKKNKIRCLLLTYQENNPCTFLSVGELCSVAREGCLEKVQKLVQCGSRLRDFYEDYTPLHYAVMGGNCKVVDFLIQKGCPVDIEGWKGEKPLHLAARNGFEDISRLLILRGAAVDATNAYGSTPLHVSSQYNNLPVVEELLEGGAKVNSVNYQLNTPLHIAAIHGNSEVAALLILRGSCVSARNRNGQTPACEAVIHDKIDLMQIYVDKKLIKSYDLKELVVLAVSLNRETILNMLKNNFRIDCWVKQVSSSYNLCCFDNVDGANKSDLTKDKINYNVITKGIKKFQISSAIGEEVDIFHDIEQDKSNSTESINLIPPKVPVIRDKNGNSNLHIAVMEKKLNLVRKLLENGAKVNLTNKNRDTPLHLAAKNGSVLIVKELLKNKADIKLTNSKGCTPIHLSAKLGNLSTLDILLEQGNNVICQDKDGNTPLHLAAQQGQFECVKLLIKKRSNLKCLNRKGLTPLQVASKLGHERVSQIIVQHDLD